MAIIISEVFGKSESGSIDKNGSRSLVRNFHVYADGVAPDTGELSLDSALSASGLPAEPSGGESNATVTADGRTFYYWGSRDFSRATSSQTIWLLSYTYSASVVSIGDTAPDEKSGGVRATTRGVYRANVSAPPPDDVLLQADISGDPVDSGGVKTTITHPQATLSIRTYQIAEPLIGQFQDYVGKRNLDPYQGGISGSVLFVGIQFSLNTSINQWVLDYEFAFDERTLHADQVARVDPSGAVDTIPHGVGANKSPVARHVYWVQPFKRVSFAGLPQ
jgi:hypothetical protein